MNRYSRLLSLAKGIAGGASVAVTKATVEWLAHFKLPNAFEIAVLLLVAVIGYQIASFLIWAGFNRLKFLRRMLLGNQFVEGPWFFEVSRQGEVESLAFVHMKAEDGTLGWSGVHYNLDGSIKGGVNGQILEVEWPVIRYLFTSHRATTATPTRGGYGERSFVERDGPPVQLTGFFVDFLSGERNDTLAWKIVDRNLIKKLDDPKFCIEFVRNYKPVSGARANGEGVAVLPQSIVPISSPDRSTPASDDAASPLVQ